jgi:hypothetical protein
MPSGTIRAFAADIVNTLYPSEKNLLFDDDIMRYFDYIADFTGNGQTFDRSRAGLSEIIEIAYDVQIRHALMSNDSFVWMAHNRPPCLFLDNSYIPTYQQQFNIAFFGSVTQTPNVPIDEDMSSLLLNPPVQFVNIDRVNQAQIIWHHFYRDMSTLRLKGVPPLLQTSSIYSPK